MFLLIAFINFLLFAGDNGQDVLDPYGCQEVTSATKRLHEDLFCNYDTDVRPVKNLKNATIIKMQLIVEYIQLVDYESKISIHNWLFLEWNDEHLTWNPEEYDGVKDLQLSSYQLWTPDISLFNGFDPSSPSAMGSSNCLVKSNGTVTCISRNVYEGFCVPNFKNWPYNTQKCDIHIGSWSSKGDEINFEFYSDSGYNIDSYEANNEWELVTIKTHYSPGHYDCCPNETFPMVGYYFTMAHHASIFVATLVAPAFVMVALNMIATSLNPLSNIRIPLISANILSHIHYLQTMVDHVYANGAECPLITLFYRDSLLITILMLCLSILIKSLYQWNISSPTWLSKSSSIVLSNKIGQIILLNTTDPKEIAAIMDNNDDEGNLVETNNQKTQQWRLLGAALDKLSFCIYIIVYSILCNRLIP